MGRWGGELKSYSRQTKRNKGEKRGGSETTESNQKRQGLYLKYLGLAFNDQ